MWKKSFFHSYIEQIDSWSIYSVFLIKNSKQIFTQFKNENWSMWPVLFYFKEDNNKWNTRLFNFEIIKGTI